MFTISSRALNPS